MKLWGGRFAEGPSEVFENFSESLSFDRRLIGPDVRGSQTFARALKSAGILSEAECDSIIEALGQILKESEEPGYFDGAEDEDIHTFVIRKLKEKLRLKNLKALSLNRNK
jgi:argininosuccinate lyase